MQLMPTTARRFGAFQPFDIEQNIAAGTRYVTTLMWEFHGDLRLVAAAYYAGDRWVGKKQLNYRNPDVVAYVGGSTAYLMRKSAARQSAEEMNRHETSLDHSYCNPTSIRLYASTLPSGAGRDRHHRPQRGNAALFAT